MLAYYLLAILVLFRIHLPTVTSNQDVCSESSIKIDIKDPEYFLVPTSNETYSSNMSCRWNLNVKYPKNYILQIDFDLLLTFNDLLILELCDIHNLLYSSMSNSDIVQLFTEEERVCLHFNSTKHLDDNETYFWSVHFLLVPKRPTIEKIKLSQNNPIHSTASLNNSTQYLITKTNGTLEIFYYGINLEGNSNGLIYFFESAGLKNLSRIVSFPSPKVLNFTTNASELTFIYTGGTSNNIVIVSRIVEFHAQHCNTASNVDVIHSNFALDINKEIISNEKGSCHYSIIMPNINTNENDLYSAIVLASALYKGNDEVMIVSGYNDTFLLYKFNETISKDYTLALFGLLTSIVIPPNGYLTMNYHLNEFFSGFDPIIHYFVKNIHFLDMSPSYPNMANLGLFVDGDVFACTSGTATWKVSINAEIPEKCPFIFYADDQPPVKVWNSSLFHLLLNFTAVKLVTVFNGTACANDTYRGYVVQIDAEYTESDNTKTVPPDYPLIIGLSAGGFIVVCMIIVSIAIYCIRSKQKRYNKIYKLLEEMNLTQEEINEMKLKSDGLLIKPGKIHINFDTILGKGASSTVHKGHLIGSAPLHEQWKNEQTEQFVDCDVAVKVTNHFGTSEVEQLFKEIDAMKKIGYHENVMCLLGWALPGETPCLVFEIAHKDLLHYVSEFKELVDELVPYKNFLSILWQITKGMQFTASKGLVHCDLAARNVLLFDNMVAKISDFGLCCSSDETFSYQASLNKKLPIKWLSLEALLDRLFTEKSDVWSFGVLMYEMFSFGETPYATMNNDELVMFLQSGGRLERPASMDDVCYGIMLLCWNKDFRARPRFMELEEKFGELISKYSV